MPYLKKYHFLVLFVSIFMYTGLSHGQSVIQGDDPDPDLEAAAEQRAEYWKDELSMTSKQTDLMERKIIEFSIKKAKLLQSKMREEEKTERLKRLQILENMDMRDILTRPQYKRYILLLTKEMEKRDYLE